MEGSLPSLPEELLPLAKGSVGCRKAPSLAEQEATVPGQWFFGVTAQQQLALKGSPALWSLWRLWDFEKV